MGVAFNGSSSLLLNDYLESKQELAELRTKARYKSSEQMIDRIKHLEVKIVENISMFDREQLREIIFMSLDIDPEELKEDGLVK